MGRGKKSDLPDMADLAVPGQEIAVRAVPKASRNAIHRTAEGIKIMVTAVPENGKATAAIQTLLARAMGVAPSDLVLRRGATSRDKVFVYLG